MKVALFLHAYQPPIQFAEITQAITAESYIPILETIASVSSARATINFAGSLTEQFLQTDRQDVLEKVRYLLQQQQIELVSSAAYHPLLARLPDDEIVRQKQLNDAINHQAYGDLYQPRGFFLPEMVYERRVAEVLSSAGVEWLMLDESAFPTAPYEEHWGTHDHEKLQIGSKLHRIIGLPTYAFFRDRPLSLQVAFTGDISVETLIPSLKEHFITGQESYTILAMDAETFGHHHKENLAFLRALLSHPQIEPVTVSEILSLQLEQDDVEPVRSTWGVTTEDSHQQRTFPRWDNPKNPVHKLQWELFNLAIALREHNSEFPDELDRALNSDQFWWASNNPCWHPQMLERGLSLLVQAIDDSPKSTDAEKAQARALSEQALKIGIQVFGSDVQNC